MQVCVPAGKRQNVFTTREHRKKTKKKWTIAVMKGVSATEKKSAGKKINTSEAWKIQKSKYS